jgi:hypothetical protein
MRSVRVALAIGLAVTAIAVAVTLSGSPLEVAGTNAIPSAAQVVAGNGTQACQGNEVLPGGTTAIRLSLEALIGPRVSVTARVGERVLTHGVHGAGWKAAAVTVPVQSVAHTTPHAQVCFALASSYAPVIILGERTRHALAATAAGGPLPGRMSIEYLRPGHRSWWSRAGSVARRMGFGRAAGGAWIALLVAACTTAIVALSLWLAVRELR